MLILTRRAMETIVIGDDIFITVLKSKCPTQVRLAITAPPHISVHRKEIYNRIMRETNGVIIPPLPIERGL